MGKIKNLIVVMEMMIIIMTVMEMMMMIIMMVMEIIIVILVMVRIIIMVVEMIIIMVMVMMIVYNGDDEKYNYGHDDLQFLIKINVTTNTMRVEEKNQICYQVRKRKDWKMSLKFEFLPNNWVLITKMFSTAGAFNQISPGQKQYEFEPHSLIILYFSATILFPHCCRCNCMSGSW